MQLAVLCLPQIIILSAKHRAVGNMNQLDWSLNSAKGNCSEITYEKFERCPPPSQ